MKTLLTTLAALLLASTTAHAQFSLTTFDGKTIANKNKPDTTTPGMESKFYFVWEADFVRIQWQTSINDKPVITEALVYYIDVNLKMLKPEEMPLPDGKGTAYGIEIKSKKAKSFPEYSWRADSYTQQMSDTESLIFASKSELKSFMDKLTARCKTAKAPTKRIVLKQMVKEKK